MPDWPSEVVPYDMTFNVVSNNFAFTSPFNSSQQIVGHPGGYWQASIELPLLDEQQGRIMSSFLHSLHGMVGTFRMPTWHRRPPPGAGNATVDTGGQRGGQLATRGWASGRVVLLRGDYIVVNGQLHEVLANVESNAQGRAVIPIAPWIRVPPPGGAHINYTEPYCVMRLTEDGAESSYQGIIASASLTCREAF